MSFIQDTKINLIWLRDNCRCDQCYNWDSHQRILNDVQIEKIQIKSLEEKGDEIIVNWIDGHISKYNINWIKVQQRPEVGIDPVLWTGTEKQDEIPIATDKDSDEQVAKILIKSLLQFGIGLVKDVPVSMEGTENTVKKLGPIMHTIYGGMWQLSTTSGFEKYQDTAYTTQELSVHTDNTYFIEPAGLQVFHCLKPAEQGGETVLVDGFNAAYKLKEENRTHYECLKSTPVEWQYISDHHHYTCVRPVINTFSNSEQIEQIRYNIYDRSPRICCTPQHNQNSFYSSLKHFRDVVNDTKMEWKFKLTPGIVLFTNNWRVFHGRKGYSGSRVIAGCYMGMNALLSKGRMLKLIS